MDANLCQHSLVASNRQVQRRFKNSGEAQTAIGGQARGGSVTTGNRTLNNADDVILANNTSPITVTLPAANSSSIAPGQIFTVRSINTGSVTIAAGGESVDRAATASIAAGGKASFMTDGTSWWSI